MKVKVSELQGAALDWAVAAALNAQYDEDRVVKICRHESTTPAWIERENSAGSAPQYHRFSPATDWALAGPIIERGSIATRHSPKHGLWFAIISIESGETMFWHRTVYQNQKRVQVRFEGATPLIAAMRCYVASKMGDEIEIPDELIQEA